MITAVDTSVLLDVFRCDPKFVTRSQEALRRTIREGALVACKPGPRAARPGAGARR